MVSIPSRLAPFRFVKIPAREKGPKEKGWTTDANYDITNTSLLDHINSGGNYGVLCGYNNLLVLDFDEMGIYEKVKDRLPKTFTVLSGTQKPHLYYYVDKPENKKIKTKDNNTLVDVQGPRRQVVGPGSVHPNGNKYEVLCDTDIVSISMDEIKAVFGEYLIDEEMKEQKYEAPDDVDSEIRKRVLISSILQQHNIKATPTSVAKVNCACPFHSSKAGKCLSFDDYNKDGVWHCFHCEKGGNVIKLIMLLENKSYTEVREEYVKKLDLRDDKALDVIPVFQSLEDCAKQFYEINPFFFDDAGLFWIWDKNMCYWIMIDEIGLLTETKKHLPKDTEFNIGNATQRNEYLIHCKVFGRLKKPKDIDKRWVQFGHKIYDLRNKRSFDATPEYFVCNPLPYCVGENGDIPTIDRLITEWVGEKNKKVLLEWIAFCCLPDYPIHRILGNIGGGRNGKTTYTDLLRRFVGDHNCCSTELDHLIDNRFESAKLYKKLVCLMGETNWGVMKKTSMLKKLSGQDFIGFEVKNHNPFSGINYAKIVINTNSLPASGDTSEGFYRRWMILDWPNNFKEQDGLLDTIPKHEFNNLSRICLGLLTDLLSRGTFSDCSDLKEREDKYIAASNPLRGFIQERCVISYLDTDYIRYSQFYKEYVSYTRNKKRTRSPNHREMGVMLAEEGIEVENTSKDVNGVWVKDRWLVGLRWSPVDSFGTLGTLGTQNPNAITTPRAIFQPVENSVPSVPQWDENVVVYSKCVTCGNDPCNYVNGKLYCKQCISKGLRY